MVGEVADFVVSLGSNGRVASQGPVQDVLRLNSKFRQEFESDRAIEEKTEQNVVDHQRCDQQDPEQSDGKLVLEEEVAQGHVSWAALRMFWASLGGIGFWITYSSGLILRDLAIVLQTYWLRQVNGTYSTHLG
ncbi:hypothetical protein FRC12_015908 [Ceratobasidium sp. 428]|nr:hypothetical protein FRC12_015908 [Ceratobasidium sp. 428]